MSEWRPANNEVNNWALNYYLPIQSQLMDLAAGGDYHTTYWPQPSFLSSRKYHFESTFPTYHELRFKPKGDMKLKVHQIKKTREIK